jgi:Zn-dependent M28 family amino/carboxypeptidase
MVINMDMIATLNTSTPTVLLEGAEVSQGLIDDLAAAAATYTALTVQTSLHPFASDHVPFIDASIPAVLTIEGADGANANIHTAGDTLDHIDEDLAVEIVRMNLATLVSPP